VREQCHPSSPVIPTIPPCHFDHREKSSGNKLLCLHLFLSHPNSSSPVIPPLPSCHFDHPLLSFRPTGEIFRQQTIMSASLFISPPLLLSCHLTPPPLAISTIPPLSFRPSGEIFKQQTIMSTSPVISPLLLLSFRPSPLCHFDHREKSSGNKLLCPPLLSSHPSSSCHFNHPLLSFRPSGEIFRQQTIMSTSPVISPLPPLSFRPSLLVISTNGRNL